MAEQAGPIGTTAPEQQAGDQSAKPDQQVHTGASSTVSADAVRDFVAYDERQFIVSRV
jgi:hypothetical protein